MVDLKKMVSMLAETGTVTLNIDNQPQLNIGKLYKIVSSNIDIFVTQHTLVDMPKKETKAANPQVDQIINAYKTVYGCMPADSKPRFIAYTFAKFINKYVEIMAANGKQKQFDVVLTNCFNVYNSKMGAIAASTAKLQTIYKHSKQEIEKALTAANISF